LLIWRCISRRDFGAKTAQREPRQKVEKSAENIDAANGLQGRKKQAKNTLLRLRVNCSTN